MKRSLKQKTKPKQNLEKGKKDQVNLNSKYKPNLHYSQKPVKQIDSFENVNWENLEGTKSAKNEKKENSKLDDENEENFGKVRIKINSRRH